MSDVQENKSGRTWPNSDEAISYKKKSKNAVFPKVKFSLLAHGRELRRRASELYAEPDQAVIAMGNGA